jgi:hypothetical protein
MPEGLSGGRGGKCFSRAISSAPAVQDRHCEAGRQVAGGHRHSRNLHRLCEILPTVRELGAGMSATA